MAIVSENYHTVKSRKSEMTVESEQLESQQCATVHGVHFPTIEAVAGGRIEFLGAQKYSTQRHTHKTATHTILSFRNMYFDSFSRTLVILNLHSESSNSSLHESYQRFYL